MPKYKSLLGAKLRGGTRSAGAVKKTKTAGSMKSAGSLKSAGSISSGGSISAGSVDAYDNNIDKVMRFIESDPMLLLDLLELMDSRAFNLVKEISKQHIGEGSDHHPRYVGELEKKNDLFGPHKDIAHNARDMNHLIQALHTELKSNKSGGGLWKSVKNNISKGVKHASRVIRNLPKLQNIQNKSNFYIKKIKPIAKSIDQFTSIVAPGEIPQISGFVDKADKMVNSKTASQAIKVQKTIDDALKPKQKKEEMIEE